MNTPHYVNETQKLKNILSDPKHRLKWTKHAEDRMKERNITASDVVNVLTYGQVILEEMKQDILWRVKGRDLDGNELHVQVAVLENNLTVKIVTAF